MQLGHSTASAEHWLQNSLIYSNTTLTCQKAFVSKKTGISPLLSPESTAHTLYLRNLKERRPRIPLSF